MEQLDELREFINELYIRIDYADYLTLINYVDEIYDEFNDTKQELDNIKMDKEWNKIELKKNVTTKKKKLTEQILYGMEQLQR